MKSLNSAEQRALLQLGVRTRIKQLEEELARLRGWKTSATAAPKPGKRRMTMAQRKALSERMKAYWKKRSVKEASRHAVSRVQ